MTPSIFRALRGPRSRAAAQIITNGRVLQPVRVHAITPVADQAVLLDLRPLEDLALAGFDAGAHVDLHIDQQVVRQYSLVGGSEEGDRYLICVQRDPAGRGGSAAIHDRVAVGDALHVSAPRNTFPLREHTAPVLLLSGGVGITPLVSMAAQLRREGHPFQLHAYSRNPQTLPLHAQLAESPYRDRVTTHFSDDGDSFRTQAPSLLTDPHPGGAVYVCGPDAFVDLARRRAVDAGWHHDQIVSERFSAGASPTRNDTGTFTVVAASTGQSFDVGPAESIADVLERHGYDTYRSCGQGYCGSCVTRVLEGIPDHRDDFQSDSEHALNTQINVCCSRSFTPVLELDI